MVEWIIALTDEAATKAHSSAGSNLSASRRLSDETRLPTTNVVFPHIKNLHGFPLAKITLGGSLTLVGRFYGDGREAFTTFFPIFY